MIFRKLFICMTTMLVEQYASRYRRVYISDNSDVQVKINHAISTAIRAYAVGVKLII